MSEPQDTAEHTSSTPSEVWLQSGGWIDGARNPPRFYVDRDEMNADRVAAGYPPLPPPLLAPENTPPSGPALPVPQPALGEESLTAPAVAAGNDTVPLDAAGHLVSVTITFSTPTPAGGPRSARGQKKTKLEKVVKSDHIQVLDSTSRVDFIHAALAVHDLQEQYRASTHTGPPIKIWWTGSSGGKSGASTIDNDREFQVTKTEILRKNKDSCKVNVEFDLDNMDGFRPLSIVGGGGDDDGKLRHGDKVPRLELFSEEDQLYGRIVMQLKAMWACESHPGENGESGYCYVDSTGQHLGLNNRRLKLWSSAIAAADCTKHAPPNTVDFDCIRDARLNVLKLRGRAGPSSSAQPSTSDLSTMVMAAMLPIITSHLAPKTPSTPTHTRVTSTVSAPTTPTRIRPSERPQSPAPAPGTELSICTGDFLKVKGIDLSSSAPALAALELTPDIIFEVPVARLCDLMGAVEGRVRKFQVFCKEWVDRVEDKRRRGL